MAHYKRKRKHWQRLCMCKYYKRAAGNGKERRPPREGEDRKRFRNGREL